MASHKLSFGEYVYAKDIDSGGFGNVRLYIHQGNDKRVAVKEERRSDPENLKLLEKECELLKKLTHANIVEYYNLPEFCGHNIFYITMEYCEDGNLKMLLESSYCGLVGDTIIEITKQLASGLRYLHGKKIVHRDLKPRNIVISKKGDKKIYKIIDFGLSKDLTEESSLHSGVGTIGWQAPEVMLHPHGGYSRTADFWSFGLVIHKCITGCISFFHEAEENYGSLMTQYIKPKKMGTESQKIPYDQDKIIFMELDMDSRGLRHSTRIELPHHLTKTLWLKYTAFLRHMLRYDKEARGRNTKGEDTCWYNLGNTITNVEFFSVFCVPTAQCLTYSIVKHRHNIKDILSEEMEIPKDAILLIGYDGRELSEKSEQYKDVGVDEPSFFLFSQPDPASDIKQMPDPNKLLMEPPEFYNRKMKDRESCSSRGLERLRCQAGFYCEQNIRKLRWLVTAYEALDRNFLSIFNQIFPRFQVEKKSFCELDVDSLKTNRKEYEEYKLRKAQVTRLFNEEYELAKSLIEEHKPAQLSLPKHSRELADIESEVKVKLSKDAIKGPSRIKDTMSYIFSVVSTLEEKLLHHQRELIKSLSKLLNSKTSRDNFLRKIKANTTKIAKMIKETKQKELFLHNQELESTSSEYTSMDSDTNSSTEENTSTN